MKQDKLTNMSMLLQLYGKLLTDRQRTSLQLYYDCDCSLTEIAEQVNISRQAVRDCIVKGEQSLIGFEAKLGILAKFNLINKYVKQIQLQYVDDTAKQEVIDNLAKLVNVTEAD